jgi:dTDP-3-amino-2,3,6-trideoxy-4-keto-D-glucose/dTDP-3-amino-3,4,6-trideoxy-alpha-D-glucose/dTDP-2,6-dideoxy-D-kanosamine transaminase
MKVSYSYLPRQFEKADDIWVEVKKAVTDGDFTLGHRVEKFEQEFANFIGTKYAVGVNSGTDALRLSLIALGIGKSPDDEVITTANTFVATAGAIETAGARIRFVDCNEKYVMDTDKIEAAITENTKAIMPVHYTGQPVDMDRLMKLADRYKLHIVEDACCAIDAEFKGKRCGTFGISAGFSLHPQKNLNVWSDGGLVTTDSVEMRDQLRLLRNHGMIDRDHYAFYAYNSRLDTVQAVVGSYLLKDVKWITQRRLDVAHRIDKGLMGLAPRVVVPARDSFERRVYHMYMVLVEKRDELYSWLLSKGVDAKIHYPIPLHLQQASHKLGYKLGDFPVAEYQAQNVISFPAHQHLTDEEVDYIIEMVREFYSQQES